MTDEEELSLVYERVGRALSEWVKVENGLIRIFQTCVGSMGLAMAIMGKFDTFGARLNLTSSALHAQLDVHDEADEFLRRWWEKLKKRIGDLGLYRNRLAHHQVVLFAGEEPIGRRAKLFYPNERIFAGYQPNELDLDAERIVTITDIFGRRAEQLSCFNEVFRSRPSIKFRHARALKDELLFWNRTDDGSAVEEVAVILRDVKCLF